MNDTQNGATSRTWHDQSIEATLARLKSIPLGLSETEAQTRLTEHGLNRLPEPPRRAALTRFFLQFHNLLIYVLVGAAVITALLDHLTDTLVILAVVAVNAVIGFMQEGKAEKAMAALHQMLAPRATVVRDGERRAISAEMVVPGDIVLLEAGDKVPADVRLIQTHGLTIQEAILTGESVPVDKYTDPVAANAPLGDRSSLAFSGTFITSGQGKGVVVDTGATTEIGRISGLLSKVQTLTTPLIQQMSVFAKWLTAFILVVAALILAFGYFVQGHPFAELFMAVVGLSVAAIPEGLPAVLTITLAIGVQAMAKRNVIVRQLPAIETLGSVSVICTDKTGTLTRNEMMVASTATYGKSYTVTGSGYDPDGNIRLHDTIVEGRSHTILVEMARVATLCNDAALHKTDMGWTIEGDPMEGALLTFARKMGLEEREEMRSWTRTDAIPFDSKHRFMATLNHNHEKRALVCVKGAPEKLLEMCETQKSEDGSREPLDKTWWQKQVEEMAGRGQRVLALAAKPGLSEHTVLDFADIEEGLVLVGLVGLIDPPRAEAIRAVTECHEAGIRVKMITGDHAKTAAAIGRQIGLRNFERILTGAELDTLDETGLAAAVVNTDIFARTSPEHKLRLVMALQSHGMIVAMTGDGVNDAPALKRADAGIAMGKKGSEAAKEASELVLADDNFASIVAGVREGRTVYDNLKKVISWTLPTNAGEAVTIVVALLFGMMLPVTPIQILWVNLITATTLGLALAFEPTEPGTMRRPPRLRGEPLLTGTLAWHIVFVSVLFLCGVFGMFFYALKQGYSIELARTISVNTLVVMEVFHLFFIRNIYGTSLTLKAVMGTPVVWLTVAIITVAQFVVTYVPFFQRIFATEGVPIIDGFIIIGVGIALFTMVEIEKQLRLRWMAMRNNNPTF